MGSSSGSQTQVQKSEPWGPQGDRLKKAFGRTDTLYGADQGLTSGQREYYPGATYTPFAPETESALSMTADRAMQGSEVQRGANTLAGDTLGGKYLQGNPHLNDMYDRGARSVTDQFTKSVIPSINSTFAQAGRYGSGAQKEMFGQATDRLGRTLSEMYTDMAMPMYEAERGRQMQTMSAAPGIAAGDYADAAQLGNVGIQREGLYEQQLADDMRRYDFRQNEPEAAVQRYIAMLGGNYGQMAQTTNPIYRNRSAGALGGAVGGYGMTGSPWGALAGGLAGMM